MESCIGVVSPKSSGRGGKIKKANCALPSRISHQDKRAGQGWQWDLTPSEQLHTGYRSQAFQGGGNESCLGALLLQELRQVSLQGDSSEPAAFSGTCWK